MMVKRLSGEYIIKQYARTIEEIERGNKQKGFPVAHEYSESPTALVNQFQSLFTNVYEVLLLFLRSIKHSFIFMMILFCMPILLMSAGALLSIWISYGGASPNKLF